MLSDNRNEYDCVCADAKKYVSKANNFLQGAWLLCKDAMLLSMANVLNSNIIEGPGINSITL